MGCENVMMRLGVAEFWLRSMLRRQRRGAPDVTATSVALCRNPALAAILGTAPEVQSRLLPGRPRVIYGWGQRASGLRARRIADRLGARHAVIEDGFLRSVDRMAPTVSLIFDDEGIYYDASRPSRLERLIATPICEPERKRALELAESWRSHGLSKFNGARDYDGPLPARYVLVVDQVAGDLSVPGGLAGAEDFQRMLRAALAENPDAEVVVKVHPDVRTRAQAGHYDIARLQQMDRVTVIDAPCHPVRLIREARKVYTVTSQMGFEALLHEVPVRCFGMPFYAGWGLTQDEMPAPERRQVGTTLAQLIHAALIAYPQYVDPERGVPATPEAAVAYMGLQRRNRALYPPQIHAIGFSPWKRQVLRDFLQGSQVTLHAEASSVPEGATLALWGNETPQGLPPGIRFLRLEDGFLRSSGLGADLVRPLSWVVDDLGLYYDATRPSRLEQMVQAGVDPALIPRAQDLRARIVRAGVTKYNLRAGGWQRPGGLIRVILVPGQVESDASLRYGAPGVNRNLDLLRAVRAENPDAHILYKPHPDVVAGLRRSGQGEGEAHLHCDEVLTDTDPVSLLGQVDEVHTMTSLLGFEALLRGVPVTCYGKPFYSGWGLTRDMLASERRTRVVSLEELVAVALITYPRYISRTTGCFSSPERAVDELVAWKTAGPTRQSPLRRAKRKVLQLWVSSGLRKNG